MNCLKCNDTGEVFLIGNFKTPCISCIEPQEAFKYALKEGPSNATRKRACDHPEWAYKYARDVDRSPRPDTRTGSCGDPWAALLYAESIDKAPCSETRAAAYRCPELAHDYRALFQEKISAEIIKAKEDSIREGEERRKANDLDAGICPDIDEM